MRLGIALYYIGVDAAHWALVLTPSDWHAPRCSVYQIVRISGDRWRQHLSIVPLPNAPEFRGIIELIAADDLPGPETQPYPWDDSSDDESARLWEICDRVIREHAKDANEPAKRKVIPGPHGWTCAAWVLDVLMDLEDIGIFDLPLEITWASIYSDVVATGWILRDLYEDARPFPVLRLVSPRHGGANVVRI
ncbi:hypothetical protein FB107DRAFT_202429 [Schizophyllum commune]